MPPTPNTILRPVTLADVPTMASVASVSFLDDDTLGKFTHPNRQAFPADWTYSWVKDIRTHIVAPATQNYVATDPLTGRIAGFCLVERVGDGASTTLPDSLKTKALRTLIALHNFWLGWTWRDRSADVAAVAAFESNFNEIAHYFSGKRKECWFVDFLCVHPDFQHRGVGQQLMNWVVGLARAEDPPVGVGLVSTEAADAFYDKFGFVEVGKANVGALKDVSGGNIKFYERHIR